MTIKDRINIFIERQGIRRSSFEKSCGFSNGYTRNLKENPSASKLEAILKSYPELNRVWLLSGEGEMLQSSTLASVPTHHYAKGDWGEANVMIPLVHIDSVGGVHSSNALDSSEQYIERLVPFPDARRGDIAIMQSGNSMAPTIPSGAILQIRKVEGWREYFGYGNDFVLWLANERRITKQVLKYEPDPKNYVTCHSYNPDAADEELPKKMIKEVWKVVNVLINKGW